LNLTGIATKNSVTVFVLVTLMSLAGILAFTTLPKQQDPGFTIRAAVVTTRFDGASPERVEQLVTDKIEQAIQEMPELDNVTSESTPGFSFVVANFKESYTEMQPIFDTLRRKIQAVKGLPDGIQQPEVDDEYGDVFGSVFALTGEGYSYAELEDIAEDIRDDLLKYEDIAKVELQGVQDEEVYVEYNIAKLEELGISPKQFSQLLDSVNIIRGGGNIRSGRERITLEPTGNFESLEDIRRTVVQLPDSSTTVYLEDIANIYRDYKDPPQSFASFNGKPAIIVSISLREGGNILELGQTLLADIPAIEATYPYGIALNPVYLESIVVDASVSSFVSNLLQAIGIVVLVMLVFLGFRTGLIVASLIPVTIFVSLLMMDVFSITINQISLAALIIALGLLVDNAIVMSESIMVRREDGESAVDAAISTGSEMAVPLLTSSLTTAAAFLPIFLAESSVGEYTADIFKVVTIALLSSWFLAMTFIPLLTITFMKIKGSREPQTYDSAMFRIYDVLLMFSVRNRIVTLGLVAGLFYSAIWALQFVPNVFIPAKEDPFINGTLEMPRGTAIETTAEVSGAVDRFISENLVVDPATDPEAEGVVKFTSWIGQGAPRYTLALNPGASNPAAFSMLLNTTTQHAIPDVVESIQNFTRKEFPDLDVQLKKMENGAPIPYPIVIRVSGPELDTLYGIVNPMKDKLREIPGVMEVNDDWGLRTKKLVIKINPDRARRAGVTNEDIAISLQSGLTGIELTQLREGDTLIPITMRSQASDRRDIEKLEGMTIYAQSSDQTVPLSQVAEIDVVWQPGILKRRDRDKSIAVQAKLLPGVTATEVSSVLLPWVEENNKKWPRRYYYEVGGEAEASGDANEAIAAKLPLAAMIILLLLVAQFNNVRKPIMIFMTIPLGLIGVTYGLLIANTVFGFYTILGLISLAGIVINNAIVLLDRINIEITENGLAEKDAVITACKQRLRPILLTTATTIGGMLPLWISHDPQFETMAVAIMFGLLFATLITLLFIPVMYSLLFRVKFS
jgi:multidrug efflux pump subunit AcrB